MKNGYSRVIGIDVSKDTLEISDTKSKRKGKIDNFPDSIKRLIVAKITSPSQVIDLLNQEKNRLKQCRDAVTRQWINDSIKSLENQRIIIDQTLATLLDKTAENNPTVGILLSATGIGYTTTAILLGELPEIGTLSRTQIAKLAGLAPIAMQSGKEDRKRSVRGGRANVRTALYMPTVSAMRYNPTISQFARRLERKGKPHKVVVTACMRKLLTILNLMVKNQTLWGETKKGDERVSSPSPTCSIGS